jgi:hypothetical protein
MVALRISKAQILQACVEKQQRTIDDFLKEIAELKVQLFEREETESQQQRTSPERQELLLRMEHELAFLNSEMAVLRQINSNLELDEVELGAVVVTNQRTFFISTSIERIEVEGQSVIGISVKAPIYRAMREKKAGQSFLYGGVRFDILEVY